MLGLEELLYGVQPRAMRRRAELPERWRQLAIGPAVTDSREVGPGALFVALAGERTDGHSYLPDVVARGAAAALVASAAAAALQSELATVARPWALVDPADAAGLAAAPPGACLLIAVDDPLLATQRLAVYHRRSLTLTVVGITGSVGKTSTKEVVAAVLSQRLRTLKSQRSFNSEATLPTTLLGLTADHEVAVLEMGMWAPGEIRFLAAIARPLVGVVTNVGPSHLERLGSIEAIANAKAELPESLPADGWCVLNADDERVAAMATRTAAQVLTYGLGPRADLRATDLAGYGLAGIGFTAHYRGTATPLRLPLIGRHHVYTALAAAAVGLALGLDWPAIAAGLADPTAQPRLTVAPGPAGATIVDDTYNAAPISARAALGLLADLPGRRIAVLGEMLELGALATAGHQEVGAAAARAADLLIAVGSRAETIAAAAAAAGMPAGAIQICADNEAAVAALRPLLRPGDHVLVKGSRGVQMETIVAALRAAAEER